jgi:hypothetical protein
MRRDEEEGRAITLEKKMKVGSLKKLEKMKT